VIAARLRSRPERARWWDGSTEAITEFQARDLREAQTISHALALPLTALT